MFVFLTAAALFHRRTIAEAFHQLNSLSISALALILFSVVLHRFFQSALLAATVNDLSLSRAFLANEAYVACTNATVGGGAVGTGVKAGMLREWGVSGEEVATSIAATSVLPAISLWFVAMLGGIWFWFSGIANTLHLLVIGVGFCLSVGPIVFWSVMLRSPKLVAFIARRVNAVMSLVRRSQIVRRVTPRRVNTALDELDVLDAAERLRVTGAPMLGRQGLVALICALGNQATISLVLLAILRGLGALNQPPHIGPDGLVGSPLAPLGVIAVFCVARTLATFAPVPGGLGVVDAGLLSGLIAIGAHRPTALAAIGLFRAVTFVLPMITGPFTVACWRRSLARRHRLFVSQSDGAVDNALGLIPVSSAALMASPALADVA